MRKLAVAILTAITLAACAAQTGDEELPPVAAPAPSAAPWEDPLEIIGEGEPQTYYQYIDEYGNVRFE